MNQMKKNTFTKLLAIAGTILVWVPILAPLGFAMIMLVSQKRFLFDYLMPAELFLLALIGGLLLQWAALRAQKLSALIAWSLGLAIVALGSSLGLAQLTGLATGEVEASGWQFALVASLLGVYTAALAGMGVGGLLLLREIYTKGAG
jgi:hypothetical protein